MNRCIYCNKRLGTIDLNNVCSECANERKNTHFTTQPIILSRVDFSEKPPTVEEVCKALGECLAKDVSYGAKQFYYTIEKTECIMFVTETYGDGLWSINEYLPPHLITLIGKFYESLEGEK